LLRYICQRIVPSNVPILLPLPPALEPSG